MVLAAASAAKAMPVSVGPRPSCSSRRNFRRSSSRAATIRSRDACSSSETTVECTATADWIGEHGQRATISSSELSFAGAQPNRQLSLRLAATGQRPAMHPLWRLTVASEDLVVAFDREIGQPESRTDRA